VDIYINITDENGLLLETVNIYQDGSDAEGAKEIRDWLEENYSTDPSEWANSHATRAYEEGRDAAFASERSRQGNYTDDLERAAYIKGYESVLVKDLHDERSTL